MAKVDIGNLAGEAGSVSFNTVSGGESVEKVQNAGRDVLQTLRIIAAGMALIYVVYLGVMLMIGSGNDDKVATQKRQLGYTLLAFLFINIPGGLYDVIGLEKSGNEISSKDYTGRDKEGGSVLINQSYWDVYLN